MFLSEWREFPSALCLPKKKTWWQFASRCCWNCACPWHASELVSFLIGLWTYQHLIHCTARSFFKCEIGLKTSPGRLFPPFQLLTTLCIFQKRGINVTCVNGRTHTYRVLFYKTAIVWTFTWPVIRLGNANTKVSQMKTLNICIYININGPGSSVSIATDYGLDGSGSNPGGDEIFRTSRLVLGPTQPSVQWIPGLSRG